MKKKNVLLTAVIALGFAASTMAQIPSYVPSNGLVGWWPFTGNANDESGNGNNGNVNGATLTADRFGNVSQAYSFDGIDDYVKIQNTPNILNQEYSVSIWFYSTIDYSIGNNNTLLRSGDAGICNGQGFAIANFEFKTKFGFADFSSGNFGFETSIDCSSFLTGQWYNLVFTRKNNKAIQYINGIAIDSTTNNNYTPATNCPIFIGSNWLNPGDIPWDVFNGKIDDIGIWNRALDSTEISNLYNGNICYQYITVTDTLIINTNLTGFDPVTYENTIKIWPNPTNDHITIDYGNYATLSGYQLKITNSVGQQMFQTNITQQSSYVDLGTWTGNGIYFVHLIDPQGNTVDIRKIVLQ